MPNCYRKILMLFLISYSAIAQVQKEIIPPFNIKTVSFVQEGVNVTPVFQLGEQFTLEFDDLFGNEANYYYQFVHCDYDWKPSQLTRNEYIRGFDDLRIQQYENSFNTLQMFSHYRLRLPNRETGFLVTGNYIIKILNEDKEVVFSRKFILYENQVSVTTIVRRSRDVKNIDYKHNLDFTIKAGLNQFQNPLTNVKVLLFKNSEINSGIKNLKPMYTLGSDLIYKYQKETEFWAGNEYHYFDNKEIQYANNYIGKVDRTTDLYSAKLYVNEARRNKDYTLFPDENGNFKAYALNVEFNNIGSDYAWVHFSLSAPTYFGKDDIYVVGMFNDYKFTPENQMIYNPEKGLYEKAILIKQGFTNYKYVIANKDGVVDQENAVDGNFWQTENNYTILVYYRDGNQIYDKVVGKGSASSRDLIN